MAHLVSAYPENREYRLYLGRLYFWNQDYDDSKKVLQSLISGENLEQEVLDLLLQLDLATGDYPGLLLKSGIAIEVFPKDKDQYNIYNAIALKHTGQT